MPRVDLIGKVSRERTFCKQEKSLMSSSSHSAAWSYQEGLHARLEQIEGRGEESRLVPGSQQEQGYGCWRR